jgi:hypothetical protein
MLQKLEYTKQLNLQRRKKSLNTGKWHAMGHLLYKEMFKKANNLYEYLSNEILLKNQVKSFKTGKFFTVLQ